MIDTAPRFVRSILRSLLEVAVVALGSLIVPMVVVSVTTGNSGQIAFWSSLAQSGVVVMASLPMTIEGHYAYLTSLTNKPELGPWLTNFIYTSILLCSGLLLWYTYRPAPPDQLLPLLDVQFGLFGWACLYRFVLKFFVYWR